jgi:hypothetical protein
VGCTVRQLRPQMDADGRSHVSEGDASTTRSDPCVTCSRLTERWTQQRVCSISRADPSSRPSIHEKQTARKASTTNSATYAGDAGSLTVVDFKRGEEFVVVLSRNGLAGGSGTSPKKLRTAIRSIRFRMAC